MEERWNPENFAVMVEAAHDAIVLGMNNGTHMETLDLMFNEVLDAVAGPGGDLRRGQLTGLHSIFVAAIFIGREYQKTGIVNDGKWKRTGV